MIPRRHGIHRPRFEPSPLRPIKIIIAWSLSVLGLLLPWRARILFSELLGWVAQLVPPELYAMEELDAGSAPPREDA